MSSFDCVVCASGQAPEVNRLKAEGKGTRRIAEEKSFTRWAVRQHLERCETPPFSDEPLKTEKTLDLDGDTGTISVNSVPEQITDWTKLLEMWDLSPEHFEVIEPVAMSARDLANGQRLFSYRAKIRKVEPGANAVTERLTEWRDSLRGFTLPPRRPTVGSTYVIKIADPQIGKKGTFEAIENWQKGVVGHVERVKRLKCSGVPIDCILVAFLGDEHEGVANNYTNQPHTVEMNFSTQLEVDFDLRMWTIKYVRDAIDDINLKVSSVISNHGEFTRNGSKEPVTSKGDNSSTMITRLVKRAFDGIPGYKETEWLIADGEPAIVTELSGVKTYLSHGYIEKGRGTSPEARQVAAMNAQILGDPLGLGDVKVFLLAHYHHAWSRQDRNFTVFGAPALEAKQSSEWMMEQYGVWSEPGMAGLLIGTEQGPIGWGEYTII